MDKKTFVSWMIVCIITHIIRSVYEILKHKKVLKATKLSFVIIFTNMVVLWTSWFMICAHDIHRIEPNDFIKYLGITLFGLGMVTFFTALFTIKSLESYDGDLITKGIYSKVRHPMYLGFILWLIGLPLIFGAQFSFILAIVFIANVLFWRHLEEKELIKRYKDYRDYKKTTLF